MTEHAHHISPAGAHTHSLPADAQGAHSHGTGQFHGAAAGGEVEARPGNADINSVTLDTPITRGKQVISKITLRKPNAGELRGTSLNALVNLDVNALGLVLPRITTPTLTSFDVEQLDPADLVQLGVVFAGFLLPKRAQ